jgi:hypothetical protein
LVRGPLGRCRGLGRAERRLGCWAASVRVRRRWQGKAPPRAHRALVIGVTASDGTSAGVTTSPAMRNHPTSIARPRPRGSWSRRQCRVATFTIALGAITATLMIALGAITATLMIALGVITATLMIALGTAPMLVRNGRYGQRHPRLDAPIETRPPAAHHIETTIGRSAAAIRSNRHSGEGTRSARSMRCGRRRSSQGRGSITLGWQIRGSCHRTGSVSCGASEMRHDARDGSARRRSARRRPGACTAPSPG